MKLKKVTRYLLALMLVCSLAFVFASCGDSSGADTGDNSGDHVHSFKLQTLEAEYLKSEANCTDPAVYYYSCSCGEKGTETFTAGVAYGHDFTKAELVTAATCENAAIYKILCSRCGAEKGETFSSGDPLGHSYIEAVIDSALKSEATCSAAAEYYKSCGRCKANSTETFTNGNPLSHSYVTEVKDEALVSEATCTVGAKYYESCSVCGELGENIFTTAEKLPHTLTYVPYKAATTSENGNEAYWECSECSNYFSDENGENLIENKADVFIPALTHAHAYNVKNTASDYLKTAATCTSKAVYYFSCECGEMGTDTFEDGDPLPHAFAKTPNADCLKSEATCTEAAVYYQSCSVCGEKNRDKTFTYGDLAAHSSVTHYDEVAATCTKQGTLEYWRCADCGKYFTDAICSVEVKYTALITTTAHNYADVVKGEYLKSDATCQSPAIYHKSCTDCGLASSNEDDIFTSGDKVECEYVVVDDGTVSATCYSEGYTLYRCIYCNNIEKYDVTAKLTHLPSENYRVLSDPECGKTGVGEYFCDNCDATREVVIPALDHTYVAASVKENTCESGGYTTYACECGDSYIADYTDALNHEWEDTKRVEATCTADGYVLQVCKNNAAHTNVVVLSDRPDHDYTKATCTDDSVCSACGAFGSAKLGHSWEIDEAAYVAPGCTTNGSQGYNCKNCEETKTDDIVPTGHAYVWGEEVNELIDAATCTYQTVQHGVCACGAEDTKYGEETVIHSYVFIIETEATCTTPGLKKYTCTDCGTVKATEESDYYEAPEAHNYDADGKCACGKTKVVISDTSADVSADDLKNELEFSDASLSIDEATQSQLGDKNVNLTVGTVDQSEVDALANNLTDEQKALLEGKTVYNFEMSADGAPVVNFDGTITIKIPYVLGDEDPDDIVVWYLAVVVDDDGNPVLDEFGNEKHEPKLVQAKYIEIDGHGYAVFETNHFSYYTVTKLTAAERCEKFGHNFLVTDVIATCMTNGYTLHSCLRCGLKEFSNQVNPLGHKFELNEETYVAHTCTTDGYAEYACFRCQVSYVETAKSEGHVWESISKTDATCTAAGVESFKCSTCDAEREVTIPKLPHNYITVTTEPTCATPGYTTKTCDDCGYSIVTDPENALGHNDHTTVHAPTCIAQGYTEHYCDRCGQSYNDKYTVKVGHEWNVDEPTCEDDKRCIHCNVIDESATNKGRALGHKYKKGVCENCLAGCDHTDIKYSHDQKPSCTEVGYELWLCASCHNFVKGDEIPMVEHSYHKVQEFEATCISPAYTVSRCNKCKGEFVETYGEPAEHSYAGGVCTYCGKDNNNFYLNLINSIFENNGFAIRITNFRWVYENRYSTSEFVTGFYIDAIEVNELMLYFDEESGITGAAQFNVIITDGPVEGEVTVAIKALIENGYAYVELTSDYDEFNGNVRLSVDDFINMMLADMFDADASSVVGMLPFVSEDILPLLTVIVEENSGDIESVLAVIFDMLFSYENIDGDYVYTLDFDKIHSINENLKNMRIDEFVDFYFGEGAFDSVYSTLMEIMDLRVCDIPAYAEKLGISESELVEAINAVCHKMLGAPEGWDIAKVFASEEAAQYTVGMLLMDGEYDAEMIREYVGVIRALSFYALMSEGDLEVENQMFDMFEQVIDAIDAMFDFSFTTDKNGVVLSFDISADECVVMQYQYYRYIASIDLSLVFGDLIDIDWESIADSTDDMVNALPELEDGVKVDYHENGSTQGETWTDSGNYYQYYGMYYRVYKRVEKLSSPIGYAIFNECADWYGYNLMFERETYEFYYMLAAVFTESGYQYMLVHDYDFDNAIRLDVNEDTGEVTYYRPDGATGAFFIEINAQEGGFTIEQLELCFGEIDWAYSSYMSSSDIYCNTKTGEISYDNPHHYVQTEFKDAENCGVDGYYVYTCENCGDSYKSTFNHYAHELVIDLEKSDIPTECEQEGTMVYSCVNCDYSRTERVYKNHVYKNEYVLNADSESCEEGVDLIHKCQNCGDVAWTEEYFTFSHTYEFEYTYTDGSIYYSQCCQACGSASTNSYYCDVEVEGATVTLVDGIQNSNSSSGNGGITVLPGHGGNMGGNTEDTGSADGKEEYTFYLAIVPTVNATFEMYASGEYYSYAALYNQYGNILRSDSHSALNGNFGILYELEAGVTYTLRVRESDNTTIYIKPHDDSKDATFNHSDYGCSCGAVTKLTYAFGTVRLTTENTVTPDYEYGGKVDIYESPDVDYDFKYDVSYGDSLSGSATIKPGYSESGKEDVWTDGGMDNGAWDDGENMGGSIGGGSVSTGKTCVLSFSTGSSWGRDENCNEIITPEVWLHNLSTGYYGRIYTGEPTYTGNVSHSGTSGESFDEWTEITDEYGNILNCHRYGWEYICFACGNPVSMEEYVEYYNENGDRVRYEQNYYTSAYNTLYVYESRTYEYEFVYSDYGTYERMTLDDRRCYDKNGNLTEYYTYTYSYEGCKRTMTYESSYEKTYTDVEYNHTTSTKIVEEETNYDFVNDDGLRASLETYEDYCQICAASIRKYSYEYAYDAYGNEVEKIYRSYELYAESEDVYGYRLESMNVSTYLAFEYATGKFVVRQNYYRSESYSDDGEVIYWETWTREYSNACEYFYVYDDIHGSHDEYDNSDHDTCREYRLHEGATSCEDGLDRWYVCRYCDYEYLNRENYSYSHQINSYCEKQGAYYNLADYGSQCGGSLYVYTCACEERYSLNLDTECEMNYTNRWPGGKREYNIQTYACSVTNTADGFDPCGFIYTYETWIETDENCIGTRYYRYTFGVGSENPLVIEWTVATGSYYHSAEHISLDTEYYIDGEYEVYVAGYKYVCEQCGRQTYENTDTYYIDATCRVVRRVNTYKYFRESDGTVSSEHGTEYALFENPISGSTSEYHVGSFSRSYEADGVTVYDAYKSVYERIWVYSEDGTEARCVTSKEENYSYYNAESYANNTPDYWYRYVYAYTDCVCQPKRTYTNSDGSNYDETVTWNGHYGYSDYYWIVEPTCTQSGIRGQACRWCDYESSWSYGAYGHSYNYAGEFDSNLDNGSWTDGEKNDSTSLYRCSRCDLENFTGYDGTVVLEDLTWKLGNGENYAIGYYVGNGYSYEIYVEVMLGDGPDADSILLNDYIEMEDTGSVLYVNIESLKSAIANMAELSKIDISICTNMVRISFVPEYNDYDFDYAITVDAHIRSYSALDGVDGAMPSTHSASCSECGEAIIESADCRFVRSYRDSVTENGIKYEITAYSCRYCDNSYTETVWSELTDATSCTYTRYKKTEWAGGENTVEVDTYVEHNYKYSFNADSVGADKFSPTHSYACLDCGNSYDSGSCMYSGWYFNYTVDGVTYGVEYHHCPNCHFAYKRLQYSELTDTSSCEYTRYTTYLWNRNSECVFESSYVESYKYNDHTYEYVHVDGDGNSLPGTHTSVCTKCPYTETSYCNFSGTVEEIVIDGVNHRIINYACSQCKFEYVSDYYFVTDNACGGTTEYYVYTWLDSNGEEKSKTDTYVNANHIGSFSYSVNDEGYIVRSYGCKCGAVMSSAVITMNTPYDVELYTDHASRYFVFEFTPDTTTVYSFYSLNYTSDTHGYIYDADGNCIADNDDGGEGLNFRIDMELEAGKTYYLCTRFHGEWGSNEHYEGSYDVYFDLVSIPGENYDNLSNVDRDTDAWV